MNTELELQNLWPIGAKSGRCGDLIIKAVCTRSEIQRHTNNNNITSGNRIQIAVVEWKEAPPVRFPCNAGSINLHS
jgi:hypothetical protein